MSHLYKNSQHFEYLSNKERDNFLISEDDDDDDFDFKVRILYRHLIETLIRFYLFQYVPASQFKNVVKNVRRHKVKIDEERNWDYFVKRRESFEGSDTTLTNFDPATVTNIKDFLRDNIGNVDRELKRLEDDAMPEMNNFYKSIDGGRTRNGHVTVSPSRLSHLESKY